MTLLIVYLILAIGVSFLCSLLEAALLSVEQSYITLMIEQGHKSGRTLQKMKHDIDRPLAAILTLNTIAHTVGAAGVGAQSAIVFGDAWVGLTSAVLTLLILVLSEIIPKRLGAVYNRALAPFTAWMTGLLILVLTPIVKVLEWINRRVGGRKEQARLSRAELHSMAEYGRQEGAISPGEAHVIRNLLALREIEIRRIMTPRNVVFTLEQDLTVGEAVSPDRTLRFARIPIHAGDPDRITGFVARYDINQAHTRGQDQATLKELARPIRPVPEHASVADAIEQFLEHHEQLFQVVDEYGGTAGIVTLEDAMETLLGVEIVDETDAVVDMQALARRILERRQRRQGQPPPAGVEP
ncbi:MAG: DUF21 domain-containing protein [Deinococcus-Thermus bacterium]|jgi:CBS domain containing-hemolysin-like protein|nr:DUF21 domain-containing protein [Deinococcota bacterium]